MKTRRTREDWLGIFEEATNAPTSQRQWCRDHDMDIDVYFAMKTHYKKVGILPPDLGTPVTPISEKKNCLSFQDLKQGGLVHLYPKPVPRSGADSLLSIILYLMDMDAYSGERFLFLSKDRKTVHMLRWTGAGFCIARTRKEKGTVCWPGTGHVFSEEMLQEIMKMAG